MQSIDMAHKIGVKTFYERGIVPFAKNVDAMALISGLTGGASVEIIKAYNRGQADGFHEFTTVVLAGKE